MQCRPNLHADARVPQGMGSRRVPNWPKPIRILTVQRADGCGARCPYRTGVSGPKHQSI